MNPELTTNLEVKEMNVDMKTNLDKKGVDKREDEKIKTVKNDKTIANKPEDGDIGDKKIEKEKAEKKTNLGIVEDVGKKQDVEEGKRKETRLKAESVVAELPKVVKTARTDNISTTKALVEKKPSKFKLWILRTFFFRKFNKSKKDIKRNRQDLTVTESGVEHSTPVTPSTSSSSVSPINDTIPEENLEKPIVCAPVSVNDRVAERGIID